VAWFQPIAERLVAGLAPAPGEQALDIGAGRGAVSFPLCRAVGPAGSVPAVDIAPGMVRLLADDAAAQGVQNLHVEVGDATGPGLGERQYDVVAASLVLFFCPDPEATLRGWLARTRPGSGRLGITTFGPQDDVWRRVDSVFDPFLPPQMLDARTSGKRGPFADNDALVALFVACGGVGVESVEEPLEVALPDAEAWRRWSMTLGQRRMWGAVPEDRRESVFEQAAGILEESRGADGMLRLRQQVRYTLSRTA
jgi:O-methyltransferase/aklanonic acid methyltransferase